VFAKQTSSTTRAMFASVFILVICHIGACVYDLAGLDHNPIYVFPVAGMTGRHHCTQLLVEMGVSQTFLASNHKPPDLYLPSC
jgi:hypothetical protein